MAEGDIACRFDAAEYAAAPVDCATVTVVEGMLAVAGWPLAVTK